MPLTLRWDDVAVRLVLTVLAGTLVGINRSERGRPAGLRTTLLVCLAASVAMIQANLLMPTSGKAPGSFAVLDLMRLPLGILTGMGFIGGGAILRRGEMVHGVTTAATLWLVTVIGLCLGGGQLILGMAALALALVVPLVVLWALKWPETRLRQDRHAIFRARVAADGPTDDDIRAMMLGAGYVPTSWDIASNRSDAGPRRMVRCVVRWRGHPDDLRTPPFVDQLARHPGVESLRWRA